MVRSLKTLSFLILLSAVVRASSPHDGENSDAWQATVRLESAALYSGVSVSTRVVALLKRGDNLTIGLEITGEDGKWYAVTAAGERGAAGYMSGKALDVQEHGAIARWEYQPPPEPTSDPAKEASATMGDKAIAAASNARMQGDIKGFFISKFGRTLPVSAFGQTRLHSRFGFDHRNSVDVALNPDSLDGRALLAKLRGFGVPFIAFRKAIPGIATGAHIHVGNPSRRR
jgi:hypothetical protein